MGMNDTPAAERVQIAFFGCRNAGKSSLVNAITNQDLSVVSAKKGTTTDPVKKAMELLPIGPVVIIDTPGIDDEGSLGELRMKKTRQILEQADLAVLVVDAPKGLAEADKELLSLFAEKNLPYLIAYNKADLLTETLSFTEDSIAVSALTKSNITELKEKLGSLAKKNEPTKLILADLIQPKDLVVLVIPIDESAPKGRLILPQQLTLREILDQKAVAVCCQDTELKQTLAALDQKPKLVITDSQAFEQVSRDVPNDIWLTSFSILFARYKGNLAELVKGAGKLAKLKNGDAVLIAEGCTHHRQCNDIGSVKIPGWIEAFTGVKPNYSFSSGDGFPENLEDYALIVHCGGCMLNEKKMKSRIAKAAAKHVPIVNYGVAIAHMHGILKRSLEPFPQMLKLLEEEANTP